MTKSRDKYTDQFMTYVLFIKCVCTTKLQKFLIFLDSLPMLLVKRVQTL